MGDDIFMIVGAGFGQLPAIDAVRAMGLRSLAVDCDKNAPGMKTADIAIPVDIVDMEGVIAVARAHNICGVITMQSDIGVPTVGAVVDALGLPGNGRVVADRCSNKILTRQAFAERGVPQPDFEVVSSEEEAFHSASKIGFPCVIKAPDSSGSRGVVKVKAPEDIPKAVNEAKTYSRGSRLLVEEFIDGIEIGAQAFSINGHCAMALVHYDEISTPPGMVPIAHAFPSSLSHKNLERAKSAVKACVDALGIVTGPSNIDLILDREGKPHIIEVGARIGATCLPELVYYYTGIDWVQSSIQAAIGKVPELTPTRAQPCAAFILQAPRDGIMNSYSVPSDVMNHPDILEWEVTARKGDIVSQMRKGTDRIGKVVAQGATAQLAVNLARRFSTEIQFDISE